MDRKQMTNIEVKRNNRNRVYRYICKNGIVSNPDISYATKMSLPTVTQFTKELMEKGLVEEAGEFHSTGGRRAKALVVAANAKLAIGLDITKNHINLILVNLVGEILKYERFFQPFSDVEEYYQNLNMILERFLDDSGADREKILGMGISFPGIIDLNEKKITYSHVLGLTNVPFDKINCFFSYPCIFLNDANAGAYAEGSQKESADRFFYLSLSNTVGGGIFDHGELIQGNHFRCGEVGHMTIIPDGEECYCGKRGCLDAYCSAKGLSDLTDGKLDRFFEELEQGNKRIQDTWNRYTTYLAVAINNIHMVLDCNIVLGGYVGSYAEPYIMEIWNKVSQRNTFSEENIFLESCKIQMGAAALGAALKVIECFIEQV